MPLVRVSAPLLALLVASVVLAGCVAGPDPVPADAATVVEARPFIVPNGLTLPAGLAPELHATKVSDGAEPVVLATRDGTAILVGDWTGIYRSTNGGATFARAQPGLIRLLLADGWALAEDESGNVYAAGLAEARLQVTKSSNGGLTWDLATAHVPDTVGAVPDRPWVAARDDGQVALIYNDSGLTTRCMMSYDGGVTFPDVKPVAGAPIAGGVVFDGTTLIYTGDHGQVYRVAQSATAEAGLPVQCVTGGGSYDLYPWQLGRTGQIQVAAEAGATYISVPSGNNVEQVVTGTQTYSGLPRALVVSPPELKSNTFGTIKIQDGRLAVSWLGSTTPGNPTSASYNGWWNLYAAVIDDFWSDDPVVTVYEIAQDVHQGDICMDGLGCGSNQDRDLLDYMGIDIGPDGRIHLVYTHDGASSNTDVIYASFMPN